MTYRFKRPHRQFQPGDPVPESWGSGVVATLVQHQIAEAVGDATDEKAITRAVPNKRLKARDVSNKSVGGVSRTS